MATLFEQGEIVEHKVIELLNVAAPSHKIEINPAKQRNKFAIDFKEENNFADCKAEWTPFYSSMHLFGIESINCMTVDLQSVIEYNKKYGPKTALICWLNWSEQYDNFGKYIPARNAIYRATIHDLRKLKEQGKLHRHKRTSQGNEALVFDVSDITCLAICPGDYLLDPAPTEWGF